MTVALVAVGAAVGGALRYLIDRAVSSRLRGRLPLGTLAVNLLSSTTAGAFAGLGNVPPLITALMVTGLSGALSTYSTFSFETVRVAEDDGAPASAAYVALSFVGGLACATAGFRLAGW